MGFDNRDPGAYNCRMAMPLSDQLRTIIERSGLSLNEIQRRTGADKGSLSLFLRRENALTTDTLDRLTDELRLRLESDLDADE